MKRENVVEAFIWALILTLVLLGLSVCGQCPYDICENAEDITQDLGVTGCTTPQISGWCEDNEPSGLNFDQDGGNCGAINAAWWATFTVDTGGDPIVQHEVTLEWEAYAFTDYVQVWLLSGDCESLAVEYCSFTTTGGTYTTYLNQGTYYVLIDQVDIQSGEMGACVTQDSWLLGLSVPELVGTPEGLQIKRNGKRYDLAGRLIQ